jgi:hypothetical protein
MIDHIAVTYNLGREDAYLLCSLVVDLKDLRDRRRRSGFRRDALTRSSVQPAGELAVSASLAVDRTA